MNGRLFDAATMDQVGNHPSPRQPFWWQRENVDDVFIWMPESYTLGGGLHCSRARH